MDQSLFTTCMFPSQKANNVQHVQKTLFKFTLCIHSPPKAHFLVGHFIASALFHGKKHLFVSISVFFFVSFSLLSIHNKLLPLYLLRKVKMEENLNKLFHTFCRVSDSDCPLLEVLEAIRPHLQLTFENILAHINTIYVLQTRPGAMQKQERYLRLKVGE